MPPNGESPVGIGILIPEQFMLIADTAYTHGVGEGFEMACGIIHDVHRSSDLLCHSPDHLGFPWRISFFPTVHLVALVTHFKALLGKIRISLRTAQPLWVFIPRNGARVGRKFPTMSSKHLGNGLSSDLSAQIPECDIQGTDACFTNVFGDTAHGLVMTLTFQSRFPDQKMSESDGGRYDYGCTGTGRDVNADGAIIGENPHGKPFLWSSRAGFIPNPETRWICTDVGNADFEKGEFDFFDEKFFHEDSLFKF